MRSPCESITRCALVMITIFAITGTLSACGRYGSPVRVAPAEVEVEASPADVEAAEESSERRKDQED